MTHYFFPPAIPRSLVTPAFDPESGSIGVNGAPGAFAAVATNCCATPAASAVMSAAMSGDIGPGAMGAVCPVA
jgi:hypothetical protein